ncbi:hypothetical protein [Streptomyces mexicanus]|uniref:hypothetical protein n=1 Tax=Streptomyces mexicanus TaxID=178566 RepID=UPI0031EA6A9E
MAHRPYPVRGRALRQIMRRHRNEIPAQLLPPAARPWDPGHVPVYRLSTRRPSGHSS